MIDVPLVGRRKIRFRIGERLLLVFHQFRLENALHGFLFKSWSRIVLAQHLARAVRLLETSIVEIACPSMDRCALSFPNEAQRCELPQSAVRAATTASGSQAFAGWGNAFE